jgi:DNA-binding GntR family transcriptional regulator
MPPDIPDVLPAPDIPRATDRPHAPNPRRPARDRVADWLREQILRGHVAGGQLIDEKSVSERLGVSRTPVREAFQQLSGEKFLTLLPRKGAQVRAVTVTELGEVYEARLLLEGRAVEGVCDRGDGAPAAMKDLADQIDRAGAASDWFERARLDREFHLALVAAADNSILTELYASLRSRQERVAVSALTIRPERIATIDAQHRALIEALNDNDPKTATTILAAHLQLVPEVIRGLAP